jgi:hypothetical protein
MSVLGQLFVSLEDAVNTSRLDGHLVFKTGNPGQYFCLALRMAAPPTSDAYVLKEGSYGTGKEKKVLWEWHPCTPVTGTTL